MLTTTRRTSPRLRNDPHRFVRPVRNGRWQARPYCAEDGQRYNLGLFPSKEAACTAVRQFLELPPSDRRKFARPKYVRPIHYADGSVRYQVIVSIGGYRDDVGTFADIPTAVLARDLFVTRTYGPLSHLVLCRG